MAITKRNLAMMTGELFGFLTILAVPAGIVFLIYLMVTGISKADKRDHNEKIANCVATGKLYHEKTAYSEELKKCYFYKDGSKTPTFLEWDRFTRSHKPPVTE